MLIDSHCHLNNLSEITRKEILDTSRNDFQYCFIDSSIDLNSSLASSRLSASCDHVYTSLGFHPLSGESFDHQTPKAYGNLIKNNDKVIAVGEIGLDYKATISTKKQEEIFKTFIKIAKDNNLPITIHNRINPLGDKLNEPQRVLDILDEFYQTYEMVIFHCFSHSVQILERIIKKMGFVSFSLNILRKSNKILRSLEKCPLENILFETDSPYMRIKDTNSTPLDIGKVYDRAAQIKGVARDELEKQVFLNARKAFSFNPGGK
ncbi:MAG: TatD family hydrolase [Candidatus Omnitrophica bacterium]|nr:TatD family hydrolase [Candidatus Omnitrophota bacterium]